MDYQRSFAVSAAGMLIERTRVEVAAMNLANAHTVLTQGSAWKPLHVVAQAPMFQALVAQGLDAPAWPQPWVEPTGAPARRVHEPGHPLADARGFVSYPGVDPAAEMVTLMSASRAYEANVAAMNTARALALKTLEIGRAP